MLRRLPLLALLAAPGLAQTICLAEGVATSLRIATVPESNPNGPDQVVLQDVELLPLEITGRTLGREHDASRSRRVVRHGVERVELPGGGRVFRYRLSGGQQWGFLQVPADGAAHAVLELPGTGPGLADPFAAQVAVADDGLHAVVPLAGGGAHAVRLDGGHYASTGRADRQAVPAAHAVAPSSVMVGPTHFFYVATVGGQDRVFRCALADGAAPADITPPSTINDRLKDELAMSGDGQHVVFLHGPQSQQRLWHAATTGAATVLPPPPSKYEEPNYLPSGPGEPALLLDEDGSRLFYVDALVRDELYLLDLTGALPTLHVTDDPVFQPYIGVHILPRFHADQLLVAIGDPGQMDWFRADLTSGGGTVDNLTGTGSLLQPYPSGTLAPVTGADLGAAALLVEQTATGMDLRRLDPASGASAIVQQDAALTIASGSSFAGAADTVVAGAGGDRLYLGGAASPFATTPSGVALTAPVHGPFCSAVFAHLPAAWGVPVLYLADGTLVAGSIEQGPLQIVMTLPGGVLFNGTTLRYFAPGANVTLQRPAAAVRLVLSGAGG